MMLEATTIAARVVGTFQQQASLLRAHEERRMPSLSHIVELARRPAPVGVIPTFVSPAAN